MNVGRVLYWVVSGCVDGVGRGLCLGVGIAGDVSSDPIAFDRGSVTSSECDGRPSRRLWRKEMMGEGNGGRHLLVDLVTSVCSDFILTKGDTLGRD